jgi:hypothetical protein
MSDRPSDEEIFGELEEDEMSTGFKRSRKGVTMQLADEEARVIRHVLGEMLQLLTSTEPEQDDDPLAAAVGIGTSTSAPDDAALARLFPDGYTDDPEAAADFRRYTEPGLRDAKRAAAQTALATLSEPAEKRLLTSEEADAWLRALNDLRLVLGTRLDVQEDTFLDELWPNDPRAPELAVYGYLSWLQEQLVEALEPS